MIPFRIVMHQKPRVYCDYLDDAPVTTDLGGEVANNEGDGTGGREKCDQSVDDIGVTVVGFDFRRSLRPTTRPF